MTQQNSILDTALVNFDRTAAMLAGEFGKDILNKIRLPKERIELRLGPQLDDGHVHTLRAFIVRHNDALGPAKGGIRMTSNVTLDDVTGLAMEMTWKCALMGLPFGGGKSGIVADARGLSPYDKETIVRSFARNALRHVGPLLYVPAPDMGTSERDMGHFKDAISFSEGHSITHGCYVTGKPVVMGGIPGRREATGRGVAICVAQAMQSIDLKPASARAIVQGFGNVGSVTVQRLSEMGLPVVGASDLDGAVYNSKGLDVPGLFQHVQRTGSVRGFDRGEQVDGKKLLELPCEVLVPAAAANQLTADNAERIQAKIIAEGANGPTSPQGDEVLKRRKVLIVPDILCNAGGVFVSYLEYTQETQQEQMTEAEVVSRLQARMTDRYAQVAQLAEKLKSDLRTAAMYLGVSLVCQAIVARGALP